MRFLQIEILNQKAGKLLRDLADMKLISIREVENDDVFLGTLKKFRDKGKAKPISLTEITKEVEMVRAKRYASKKGSSDY